jgi:hypothetical protein
MRAMRLPDEPRTVMPKTRTLLALPTLATALLLSGCGDDGGSNAAPTPAPASASTTSAPATTAPPSPTANEAVLKRIVLRESDLENSGFDANSTGVTPESDGSSLGVASFDYCGGNFPSEAQRTGRLLVSTEGKIGSRETGIASQAIEYTDPGAAEQALQQLKAAVSGCDGGSHPTSLNDGQPLTFKPGENQADIANLPTPNYLVVTELTNGGDTRYLAQLVIQQGKYVVVNYLLSSEPVDRQSGVTLGFVSAHNAKRLQDAA